MLEEETRREREIKTGRIEACASPLDMTFLGKTLTLAFFLISRRCGVYTATHNKRERSRWSVVKIFVLWLQFCSHTVTKPADHSFFNFSALVRGCVFQRNRRCFGPSSTWKLSPTLCAKKQRKKPKCMLGRAVSIAANIFAAGSIHPWLLFECRLFKVV